MTRAILPTVREQRSGHLIITISSVAGLIGQEFTAAYAASKFALEGWMGSLRHDVAPYGTTIVGPERRRAAAGRLATLADRERQVAVAVGSGASNAEVGAALFLSEATVKAHVSRLFTKRDVTNRVQILIACMTPTSPDPLRLQK